jgi:hypothetical protein
MSDATPAKHIRRNRNHHAVFQHMKTENYDMSNQQVSKKMVTISDTYNVKF